MRIAGAGGLELTIEPERIGCTDGVDVETNASAGARTLPAVAECQSDRPVCLPGQHPHWRTQTATAALNLDHIPGGEAELTGCCWADQRHVVPAELGDGPWQLQQPAVGREATVIQRRVGSEDD